MIHFSYAKSAEQLCLELGTSQSTRGHTSARKSVREDAMPFRKPVSTLLSTCHFRVTSRCSRSSRESFKCRLPLCQQQLLLVYGSSHEEGILNTASAKFPHSHSSTPPQGPSVRNPRKCRDFSQALEERPFGFQRARLRDVWLSLSSLE